LCPEGELRNKVLSEVISGNKKASFAFAESGSRFNPNDISTTGRESSDFWELNGHKTVVFGVGQADYILISVRTDGTRFDNNGISIFCLATEHKNIEIQDYPTIDGFRAGEIKFNNLQVDKSALISNKGNAFEIINKTFLIALVAIAAEASGIMEKMYEMTLEYISTRKQFGVTIGSFQSIQHRAVEMLILSEEMSSLSSMAALSNDRSISDKKSIFSSKINIGIGGKKLGQEAIQLHGGMGVTEEMEIGQYFKRLTLLDTFLGNSDYYLKEYSKLHFG
jgi:alkylation response protein AidB-like acyl-CoA dehydrogenase